REGGPGGQTEWEIGAAGGPRGLHHQRGGRAGRRAPADASDLRAQGAAPAQAHDGQHAALLGAGHRAPPDDPGAYTTRRREPRRRQADHADADRARRASTPNGRARGGASSLPSWTAGSARAVVRLVRHRAAANARHPAVAARAGVLVTEVGAAFSRTYVVACRTR